MLTPFFALAARSPGRQQAFRRAVVAHLVVLVAAVVAAERPGGLGTPFFGLVLLSAGIAEGALLIGWRLTQLPKSQALEFLLVSPLRPRRLFVAEALVGLARLALVTLSGLPVLALLVQHGRLDPLDLPVLLLVPWTWGAVAGLGLTVWAYEPPRVRRWGERALAVGVVLYLAVGVLAGENLRQWLGGLPPGVSLSLLKGFEAFHIYNPFGVVEYWLKTDVEISWERTLGLELAALAGVGLLLWRASARLQGHFHDRHYQPVVDRSRGRRGRIGGRPLSWWAVKRVTEYSGRINIWLAGGVGGLYALYTLAGPHWPAWLGRRVFEVFEGAGGIPVLATALVLLAAVPAAFQYGLWDSSAQDRCRRLELLLLTQLGGRDYWEAAAAAAWRRGRGYFAVAVVLWLSAAAAGQAGVLQVVAALASAALLWGLYFALGFRAFSRGAQANGLGLLLTLGLPLLAFALYRAGWPALAALVPPGSVFAAGKETPTWVWLAGPVLAALAALGVARFALARCDGELRQWYDRHHGSKVID
jgi:hypothetical protein